MCVYMTSHRMRVSRQGSSVGQSMRFIPAVSRVQISPLLPESRTPEAHRAPGVFCCPAFSSSSEPRPSPSLKDHGLRDIPVRVRQGLSIQSRLRPGGTALPGFPSGFSSPAACVRIPFLYKGSSAVQRAACCQDAARPETQDTDLFRRASMNGRDPFPECKDLFRRASMNGRDPFPECKAPDRNRMLRIPRKGGSHEENGVISPVRRLSAGVSAGHGGGRYVFPGKGKQQ